LRYTTGRNFAGLIPDEVIGILSWLNPSGSTMTLESTRLLTEMSTSDICRR